MTDALKRERERKKYSVTSKTDEERCRKGIRPEGKSKQDLVSCIKVEDSKNLSALLRRILLLITCTNQHKFSFQNGYPEKY